MSAEAQNNKEEFYDKLRKELENTSDWPTQYMYKFIIPNTDEKVEKVLEKFNHTDKKVNKNYSKTGKYVSLTIITTEDTPDAVIDKYKSLENIEGLIAL